VQFNILWKERKEEEINIASELKEKKNQIQIQVIKQNEKNPSQVNERRLGVVLHFDW
jgi:D-ribose pyranose/furanose isomerase RbsD